MYSIDSTPEYITPSYIFSKVSQEDIWYYYTQLVPTVEGQYKSPVRVDQSPGCKFFYKSGYWWLTDFARGKVYNCFTIIMEMYDLNYPKVLELINSDMILKKKTNLTFNPFSITTSRKEKEKVIFLVKVKPYTQQDIDFLKSFYITSEICRKHFVYSISKYWTRTNSGDRLLYIHSDKDPCLGYKEGDKWKFYHYLRSKDEIRFIGNISFEDLQGVEQLEYKTDTLFITKSRKDVMVFNVLNEEAVAPHAEYTGKWIDKLLDSKILDRYPNKFILLDNDTTGIKTSEKISELLNIPTVYIPIESECKDISDYIKRYGKEKTINLIKQWKEK